MPGQRLTVLHWALLVSMGLHAALLGLRMGHPAAFDRLFQDSPLEVILVNARSTEAPVKAQAVAQARLAGGGEAARGRAASPLPASPTTAAGDAPEAAARRRVDELQEQQQQMLAQIRREIAQMPPVEARRRDDTASTEDPQHERRQQLLSLLAEIEKRVNEENARPKKRYISPATREAIYALYYDALRRRIEERGTRHFPEQQGRKLYGELTMNVTVDAAGRVVETEVVRPSGSRVLDLQAVAIVHAAGPFGPFSAEMRRQADQIVVTSRFRFTREDGLETTLSESLRRP